MTDDDYYDRGSRHDDRRGPPRDRNDRWDDHRDYHDQGQGPPPIDDHRTPPPPHGAPQRDDYDRRPPQDDYDRDRGPPRDDYDRGQAPPPPPGYGQVPPPPPGYGQAPPPPPGYGQAPPPHGAPQRDYYDSGPPRDDYDRDRRPQQDEYNRDRRPEQEDYNRDRRPEQEDYNRDRRPERDDYDRDRRPERDDYNRDSREPEERSPTEENAQQPPQPQAPTPKPKPNAGKRVGGLIFGVIFIFLLLMLLGIMPRPYILFDEDDPTFGKGFSLFGEGFGGDDAGNGIPSDLIGTWRTTGATLTFTAGGSGNLRMDDGFYIGFTYRVVDKNKIYFTYSGGTEEEDYSKIITLTSSTLTLQATDVSEGNYMGATTTYTKQ